MRSFDLLVWWWRLEICLYDPRITSDHSLFACSCLHPSILCTKTKNKFKFTATTVNELRDLFSQKGEVIFVNLPRRKDSRQTRGFAFVDMATKEAAQNAMSLDGYDIGGRLIRVAESLPRDQAQAEPKKYGAFCFYFLIARSCICVAPLVFVWS